VLTPKQAAERCGISVSLVYGWIESRQLAHYRMGRQGRRGRILISETDLHAFLESRKVGAHGEEGTPPRAPAIPKLKHLSL
jgi:excisionase family DNA binding protein